MSVGYPNVGGYNNYPGGKSKGDMFDEGGRGGFMGGGGGGGGGGPGGAMGGGAKLMVANINEKINRLDLEEKFSKYGKISGIQMQGNCAYLLFDREDSAVQAARMEHAVNFKGARIEVSVVPDKGMGGPPGGGPRGGDMGGRGDLGGRDMGGRDMGGRDMAGRDMAGRDMGGRDMGARDIGGRDMGPRDMGGRDMGGRDMGGRDMGGRDIGGRDIGGRDMGGRDMGGRDMGGRMGPMGRGGRRSPSGDRSFRDRGPGMGREDRFRDDMPGMGFDEPFNNRGFPRGGMDGEPFPKNPRFENFPPGPGFGRSEPPGLPVDPFVDPFKAGLPDQRKPNDCEIIVINKNQQSYAESVEQRLRNLGLMVDLLFLREEGALTHTVDDIGRRGTLFAVVIAQQHEAHGSLTLNILQGNPQEHRNMPLDDALKLIARSFHEYVQTKKKAGGPGPHTQPPMDREIRLVLSLLLDGKYVTALELERLIKYLQERRERMLGESAALQQRAAPNKGLDEGVSKVAPAEQDELQQRILDILGTSGGADMATPVANPMLNAGPVGPMGPGFNDMPLNMLGANQQPQAPQQQQQSPGNTYINFDNPSVQKALDSLIQSGPNLLKNISMTSNNSPSGGNPRGPNPQMMQQQPPQGMMGGPGGFNQGYGGGAPGGGGMQQGYRHPGNNNMMGGRPQSGGNPGAMGGGGGSGYGMGGRQMRY